MKNMKHTIVEQTIKAVKEINEAEGDFLRALARTIGKEPEDVFKKMAMASKNKLDFRRRVRAWDTDGAIKKDAIGDKWIDAQYEKAIHMNEAAKWPTKGPSQPGYYEVKTQFEIGGGAWRMTFRPGQLIKIENTPNGQRMSQWSAMKQQWSTRTPPISSNRSSGTFDLGGWGYRAEEWVGKFIKNTDEINKAVADSKAKAMTAEVVTTVGKALKQLASLPKNQKIKLTFLK